MLRKCENVLRTRNRVLHTKVIYMLAQKGEIWMMMVGIMMMGICAPISRHIHPSVFVCHSSPNAMRIHDIWNIVIPYACFRVFLPPNQCSIERRASRRRR